MAKRFVALALLVSAALIFAGCQSKVTSANYQKIQTGMTVQQVQDILGKGQPEQAAGVKVAGISSETYKWTGKEGTITITFVNGKVTVATMTPPSQK